MLKVLVLSNVSMIKDICCSLPKCVLEYNACMKILSTVCRISNSLLDIIKSLILLDHEY